MIFSHHPHLTGAELVQQMSTRLTQTRAFAPERAERQRFNVNHKLHRVTRVDASANDARGDVITINFTLRAKLSYGDSLLVVGDHASLGAWSPDNAVALTWNDDDVWRGAVTVDAATQSVAFKCATRRASGGVEWEGGDNRVIEIERVGAFEVKGAFGNGAFEVTSANGTSVEAEVRAVDGDVDGAEAAATGTWMEANARDKWVGGNLRMMTANEHSDERPSKMQWDVSGLEETGAARAIVFADENGGSWFEKLAAVANQIGIGREITREKLAVCATYLRWISTGTILCVESGGHRRPNGPAMVGRGIFISLEQIQGAMYRHGTNLGEVERAVMRHIHPWLPSFDAEFTSSVPLTRIRDIAHRNDIPDELKKTIKHTIQNKLHRNAGPEDLITTEVVLERITARDGEYSKDFVREFKEFHRELKRFFNASNVFERLEQLKGTLDADTEALIDDLGAAQRRLHESTEGGWFGEEGDALRRALEVTTTLRTFFCAGLSTGLRNDAPDESVRQRQVWRQAELAMEEYAFVLLSRCNNLMEEQSALGVEGENAWRLAANVSAFALKHISLSGWKSLEAGILARELVAWCDSHASGDKDSAIRLKASLQRAKRLIDSHTHAIMSGFGDSPTQLASAFGFDAHIGATFVESIVRAGVPFQLSRTIEMLSEGVERDIDGDGFDPIVLGSARGRLVLLNRLNPESVQACGEADIIAFVDEIDGDEEISSAGKNVKGVILSRELAHLSHLAIRARQEGIPLVSALSVEARTKVGDREGNDTIIRVDALRTELRDFDRTRDSHETGEDLSHAAVSPTVCEMVDHIKWLPLQEASTSNAGAKATMCSRLTKISSETGTFKAPSGFVLPFGSMEASMRDSSRFDELLTTLESSKTPSEIDDACLMMQTFIAANIPDEDVVEEACATLDQNARLVVRSSANVEDLSGMSAAGLYESVIGIDANDVKGVRLAIAEVWASLYSRRAVLARRAAGVPQSEARMAVLVQELSPNAVSFVLHTQSPIRGAKSVQAELCVGLGDTLASGVDGTPWRFEIDRSTGAVDVLAYANHSTSMRCRYGAPTHGKVTNEAVDYSRQELSTSEEARTRLAASLLSIATELELDLGCAQDVEGGVCGDDIVIVQTRPQPITR